jgi:hypothetical protein
MHFVLELFPQGYIPRAGRKHADTRVTEGGKVESMQGKKLWEIPVHAKRRYETEHAILAAFDRVEAASQHLHRTQRELAGLIEQDPDNEWPEMWQRFLAAGGLTCDELCRWMVHQQQIRPTVRRHLRLVAADGDQRR